MLNFKKPANLNGEKLRQELHAAGLADADPYVSDGELVISGTDDLSTASRVVEAHMGDPIPLTPEQQIEEDARLQLVALRAKAKDVAAGTSVFTAAQQQKILAQLVLRATRS